VSSPFGLDRDRLLARGADIVERSKPLIADFDASVEQVWQLWSDPRKLERWWGPPGYPATFREARPARGRRGHVLHDRSRRRPLRGCVARHGRRSAGLLESADAIADPDRTRVTEVPVSKVSVRLTQRDSGTRMELRSQFESREDLEKWLSTGTREGQQQAVAQMDVLLR